jgi:hypothetical protein
MSGSGLRMMRRSAGVIPTNRLIWLAASAVASAVASPAIQWRWPDLRRTKM